MSIGFSSVPDDQGSWVVGVGGMAGEAGAGERAAKGLAAANGLAAKEKAGGAAALGVCREAKRVRIGTEGQRRMRIERT